MHTRPAKAPSPPAPTLWVLVPGSAFKPSSFPAWALKTFYSGSWTFSLHVANALLLPILEPNSPLPPDPTARASPSIPTPPPTLTLETPGGAEEIPFPCCVCLVPMKQPLCEQEESHTAPVGRGHPHRKTLSLLCSPVCTGDTYAQRNGLRSSRL